VIPNDRERIRAVVAARYLSLSRSTLAKWRMKGEGPPYHRCGPRIVYYFKDEIDAWLDVCDRGSRSAKSESR
jgi:predicted DNA-binding transcriptional regulator AlpA